ncbi:putative membrane protein YgcG [Bacillus sp. RC252]
MKVDRGDSMGSKKSKKKQAKRQKYIKKKQEQNIPLSKKVVIMIEKTFRYICMFLYVIFCVFLCGMVKNFGITPNVIEGIFGVTLVMVEGFLFFILFDKVWPSHESKKDRKRRKKSSSDSSSSSGFGDYSSNDCSSSSDGGGDCGGGGD